MAGKKKKVHSGLKRGDKVIINTCPYYPASCGSHKAKIIGDLVQDTEGGWVAPISYMCWGSKRYANYPSKYMLKREGINMKLSTPAIVTAVILGLLVIVGFATAGNFNEMTKSRNDVTNAKAQVDTRLEERYEVIDNIVASVEGSQAQESDVFKAIAEARKVGGNATNAGDEANANAQIDQQIALLPRLQEAYPELRSNDQISKLIADVQGKALGIREARDNYNTIVTNYNTNIASFPKNIYAGIFGFKPAELFKGSAEAKVNPKVEINRE